MKLVLSDDPILLGKADRVNFPHKDLARIVCQMFRVMMTNNGCGLAAPQVGIPVRVITYRYDGKMGAMVNPIIEYKSPETTETEEGCLSFPGEKYKTSRAKDIRISYYTVERHEFHDIPVDGFLAIILQHECDHLDGIVLPQHGEKV